MRFLEAQHEALMLSLSKYEGRRCEAPPFQQGPWRAGKAVS